MARPRLPPSLLLPLLLLQASDTFAGIVDSGALLVAPKVWRAGSEERVCVTVFNVPSQTRTLIESEPSADRSISANFEPVTGDTRRRLSNILSLLRSGDRIAERRPARTTVSSAPAPIREHRSSRISRRTVEVFVGFANSKNGRSVFEDSKHVPAGSGATTSCFGVSVPETLKASYIYVKVQGKTAVWSKVRVEPNVLVTLVQTDKAKYRPGQTVKLRVLSLRQDFTALDDTIKEIWITAPEGTRLAQWLDVRMDVGLVQKEFQLTQEPPLGRWTIHVRRGDGATTKQSFDVEEFVPPRFELDVNVPGVLYRDSRVLTVKVCAKYTFGKPLVAADVRLVITSKEPNAFRQGTSENGQNKYSQETDGQGCTSIHVSISRLHGSSGIPHRITQYMVSTNVTEASTGISQLSEVVVPVKSTKLFKVIKDESPKFIKPGLDYYGTVRFERQDGSPVTSEQVEICYTVYYYREMAKKSSNRLPPIMKNANTGSPREKCKVYRTDSSGRVIYVVPAQYDEIAYITFKGRTLGTEQRFSLPLVRAWYSPSESFLLIDARSLLGGVKCGQTVTVDVRRSANFRADAMRYLVLARGDIVGDGPVHSNSVRIVINSRMAPSFRLLVYAVTDQGEVVADSKVVRVAPCLPNKVSVSWSAAQVRPGDTASLTVTGSPGSLCGVDAVDRSAQLLGTSNTVSVGKVFSQVSRLILGEKALPKLARTSYEHCSRIPTRYITSEKPSCPSSRTRRQGSNQYWDHRKIWYEEKRIETYMDEREDSVAAFDMAGLLAVTSLDLQTRPCVERIFTVRKHIKCYPIYPREGHVETSNKVGFSTLPVTGNGRAVEGEQASSSGVTTTVITGQKSVRGHTIGQIGTDSISAKRTASRAAGGERGVTEAKTSTTFGDDDRKVPLLNSTAGAVSINTQETNVEVETFRESFEPVVRFFFPETFIFQLYALGSSGQIRLTQQLPDSITRWIGSAVCSHRQVGLGLSGQSSIKVFKPFFAEINVPYSVKRGELLQLKVSVFNFLHTQLSVILRLEDVPGVQLQGQRERALCVGTDQPSVSTFPVLFTELGQRSLVVSVRATGAACGRPNDIGVQSDALVRDILVKPEGFPQEEALTERVCAKEGGSNTHVFELGFSPRVVPGSSRAVVSIYGDPLGQAITQLTGLESLVKVPHGCGEQNMVYLVPNILVHQYMKAKDMLSAELKKKTVDNMLSGYQRQLRYRHSDGSYSAFGESRWRRTQGSLWLTVYVMRWFAVARKLVPIDAEDLAASRRWVEQHQRSDGCFNRVGWLYDKAMSGGVADGGRLALTAFTVLALLEADSGSAALRRAVRCLRDGTPSGLYAQVLVAHALLEAGERAAAEAAVPGLLRRAVRGEDSLHWRSGRSSRWSGSSALDVEITAYMTLTLLRLGGHETDVAAAVRWLDRRRNGHGGWVSTQDTVVALSALVAVERRSSELKAHKVDVTVTSGNTFRRQFQVTASNRLLHQQAELRPLQLPTTVSVTAAGSGCIMAQTVLRYSLKETKAKQAFQIKHDIRPAQTGLCQTFILQICASYTTADAASNMAIIEIEMLSGFVAIDYVLQELVRSNVIRRWEVRQAVLALYFDQLVKKTLCFDVHVLQEAVVQRLKPATIAVYDYYTTEHRLETEYRLPACG
ncbi:alpha-2-macroglobulin-like [Amphibalanus amphitrite]|uniref:alpha-2-macroglobulin-like n=1 Tax=Amphibalanus amphitrite TaxID=1232801 RepID=UPI001C9183CB|nr:alpha-2-macroglobulin-like [Amphibalanus amphitrite]